MDYVMMIESYIITDSAEESVLSTVRKGIANAFKAVIELIRKFIRWIKSKLFKKKDKSSDNKAKKKPKPEVADILTDIEPEDGFDLTDDTPSSALVSINKEAQKHVRETVRQLLKYVDNTKIIITQYTSKLVDRYINESGTGYDEVTKVSSIASEVKEYCDTRKSEYLDKYAQAHLEDLYDDLKPELKALVNNLNNLERDISYKTRVYQTQTGGEIDQIVQSVSTQITNHLSELLMVVQSTLSFYESRT